MRGFVCVLGVDLNIKLGQIRFNLIFKSTPKNTDDASRFPSPPRSNSRGFSVVPKECPRREPCLAVSRGKCSMR